MAEDAFDFLLARVERAKEVIAETAEYVSAEDWADTTEKVAAEARRQNDPEASGTSEVTE